MSRTVAVAFVSLVCGILQTVPGQAAKPDGKAASVASADVLRVLRSEVATQVDRRAALAEWIRSRRDDAAALWQAGFVRDGGRWRSFDEPEPSPAARKLHEQYLARRATAPATAAGQLELADWCAKNGLPEQKRAHLNSALALEEGPGMARILDRLGYRQIAGQWLSHEQIVDWQNINRRTEASLKRWGPKLEPIARQVGGSGRSRTAGVSALREITDPSVIPAIELILCGRDEATALAAVDSLARFSGCEASQALAKQGVFSKWPDVREAAARALKERTLEDFVPQLVQLLSTPITGKVEAATTVTTTKLRPGWLLEPKLYGFIKGDLVYCYVMRRETANQFQVATFRMFNSIVDDNLKDHLFILENIGANLALREAIARGQNDTARAVEEDLEAKSRRIVQENEVIVGMNQRIGAFLSTITGQPASDDPRHWWNWWKDYVDVVLPGDKPVVHVYHEDEFVGDLEPTFMVRTSEVFQLWPSCFAAGTLVRTETGLRAIDEVAVGDRVLAKDIETGELAYKPVLQTTVRPPRELLTLRLGDETIDCTPGHKFWVSGTGWTKARDLVPASRAHTPTASTPIWSAKKTRTEKTYNLVVADFHTYFVGRAGVLCQDVTLPRPTNKVVPGLDRSQIAARRSP